MRKTVEARQLLRIVDANFNRAKEGLRVCEDVCRYGFDQPAMTRGLKDIRHGLTDALTALEIFEVIAARNIKGDVGRATTASESKRAHLKDIFYANAQRVKEALRVLEEVAKLLNPKCAQHLKELRYRFYALEQKMVTRR